MRITIWDVEEIQRRLSGWNASNGIGLELGMGKIILLIL